MEEVVQNDIVLARTVRNNAYAPYSGFKVGAVLRFQDSSRSYFGVNVENASYGASICAERSAICTGISHGESSPIRYIVVASNAEAPVVPCAVCLQCLAEFSDKDTMIYLTNTEDKVNSYRFFDFLPHPFTSFIGKDR